MGWEDEGWGGDYGSDFQADDYGSFGFDDGGSDTGDSGLLPSLVNLPTPKPVTDKEFASSKAIKVGPFSIDPVKAILGLAGLPTPLAGPFYHMANPSSPGYMYSPPGNREAVSPGYFNGGGENEAQGFAQLNRPAQKTGQGDSNIVALSGLTGLPPSEVTPLWSSIVNQKRQPLLSQYL